METTRPHANYFEETSTRLGCRPGEVQRDFSAEIASAVVGFVVDERPAPRIGFSYWRGRRFTAVL